MNMQIFQKLSHGCLLYTGIFFAVTYLYGCNGDPSSSTETELTLEEKITNIGNAATDSLRYQGLVAIESDVQSDPILFAEWEELTLFIDKWTNGREKYWQPGDQEMAAEGGYLADFFVENTWPGDSEFPADVRKASPLYPLWAFYRGRMLIWYAVEMGFLTEVYFEEGIELLTEAQTSFPNNPVIPMYLGELVPWSFDKTQPADAPTWAVYQRELLEKLMSIIDYWVTERQAIDGQFGGGWGDDVEVWRRWTPILLAFESEQANAGQRLLSEGIFDLPRMAGGYTNIMTDVEHSSEDSADSVTPMLHLAPNDPVWQDRARAIGTMMANQWTDTNDRGFLQFKSTYFTSDAVSTNNDYACDTSYHTRAMQPTLLLWQRTQEPELTSLFSSWMDMWVDVTAQENNGKPAGVLPSGAHFPSGLPGGPGGVWWNPVCHYTNKTFKYPRALSGLARSLLLTWHITGNESYLDPILSMLEMRQAYEADSTGSDDEGSAMWAASQTRGILQDVLGKYRLLSGLTSFDDYLLTNADPYVRYRLTGDVSVLEEALSSNLRSLQFNETAFKEEVRFTDRVFKFHANFANNYLEENVPNLNADLLYSMLTGDFGDASYLPLNAIKWKTEPTEFAALVNSHSTLHLDSSLYHFGTESRAIGVEFFILEPGTYPWSLTCNGTETLTGTFEQNSQNNLTVELPAQTECQLLVGNNT